LGQHFSSVFEIRSLGKSTELHTKFAKKRWNRIRILKTKPTKT
jgi:hypothetical protein